VVADPASDEESPPAIPLSGYFPACPGGLLKQTGDSIEVGSTVYKVGPTIVGAASFFVGGVQLNFTGSAWDLSFNANTPLNTGPGGEFYAGSGTTTGGSATAPDGDYPDITLTQEPGIGTFTSPAKITNIRVVSTCSST
jgi:hypothetical protein